MTAKDVIIWVLVVFIGIETTLLIDGMKRFTQSENDRINLHGLLENCRNYSEWLNEELHLERKERGIIPELKLDCQERCKG